MVIEASNQPGQLPLEPLGSARHMRRIQAAMASQRGIAQPVDDVRRFYEAKVPMGRGCLPSDVGRAVAYVIEQQYETGQALPVTGGQNMLN